jgi:RHS repeat-associated protein
MWEPETCSRRRRILPRFDAAGNLLTSTDARAKVGTYTYDALNRLLKITWTGGETVTYTYDTGTYGIGHLAKMVDPAGTTSFTYNQFGQVLTKSQVTGAVTLPLTYTYDAFGRLSALKYPSGKVIAYSYDTSGRISALSTGAGSIAYFPFGPAKSWTQPNGLTYARTFDKDGRISEIAVGGSTNVQILTYDNASRVTHLTETGLSAKTYGYDNDDRLTGFVNGTATTSYGYDADSNRSDTVTSAGTTTYHYPTTSNRLSSLSGLTTQTEPYDASGNQIGDATITYDYDARGRMSSAITGGVTTSYAVNGFGERIRKTGIDVPNGAANEYVYDEQGHLLGEYSSTGSIVNETVYLADTPVAVLTGTGGATDYSVSADWPNAPHIIQNASKQDVWTWDHFAFGDNNPNQNPDGVGTYTYNFRFPGQYADAESGMSYNGFRDYNPALGRYIQFDPVYPLNPARSGYQYANQNPLIQIDPFGLWQVTVFGGEGAAILITFGDNGNQWNFGAFVGYGFGWGVNVDYGDSGCHTPGIYLGGRVDSSFANSGYSRSTMSLNGNIADPSVTVNSQTYTYGVPRIPYGFNLNNDNGNWSLSLNGAQPASEVGFGGFAGGGATIYFPVGETLQQILSRASNSLSQSFNSFNSMLH